MYGAEVMEVVEENKKLMEIIENADIEDNTEILDVAVQFKSVKERERYE